MTDRKRYCDTIFEVGEPLIQVSNESNVPEWSRYSLDAALEAGVSWKIDTLEEIAERFGMPLDAFKAQLQTGCQERLILTYIKSPAAPQPCLISCV